MGFANATVALVVALAVIARTTSPRFTRAAASAVAWTYAAACIALVAADRDLGWGIREHGTTVALAAFVVLAVMVVGRLALGRRSG